MRRLRAVSPASANAVTAAAAPPPGRHASIASASATCGARLRSRASGKASSRAARAPSSVARATTQVRDLEQRVHDAVPMPDPAAQGERLFDESQRRFAGTGLVRLAPEPQEREPLAPAEPDLADDRERALVVLPRLRDASLGQEDARQAPQGRAPRLLGPRPRGGSRSPARSAPAPPQKRPWRRRSMPRFPVATASPCRCPSLATDREIPLDVGPRLLEAALGGEDEAEVPRGASLGHPVPGLAAGSRGPARSAPAPPRSGPGTSRRRPGRSWRRPLPSCRHVTARPLATRRKAPSASAYREVSQKRLPSACAAIPRSLVVGGLRGQALRLPRCRLLPPAPTEAVERGTFGAETQQGLRTAEPRRAGLAPRAPVRRGGSPRR